MKKSIMLILAAAVLLLVPVRGGAVTVSAGAATFFSWWEPSFENDLRGKSAFDRGLYRISSDFEMGPSFLVGPTVSVTLPAGFSVSSVFLYGSWFHAESTLDARDGSDYVRLPLDADHIVKWDLDVLLNYALNRHLKIFTGIKAQGYEYNLTNTSINVTTPGVTSVRYDVFQSGWGPGIGASLTLNIWGPLYVMTNASVLYLSTNHRLAYPGNYSWASVYHTVGCNVAASLAWYIEPASVTISLGVRYQYMHYMLNDTGTDDWFYSTDGPLANYNLMNDDHFYGITLAAIYSLEL
jgi:hypothetical protein